LSKAILIYTAMVILIANDILYPILSGYPDSIWNGIALILICAYLIMREKEEYGNKQTAKKKPIF
jgi:hypothetical protein